METTLTREVASSASVSVPTIELKKFKYAAFMSEETTCYEAEVWVNGKLGFHARNDGHGGCDFYDPVYVRATDKLLHAEFKEAMGILEAHAATLPPKDTGLPSHDPEARGEHFMMEQDVESLIGDAVHAVLADKEINKLLKKMSRHVLFAMKGGKIGTIKLPANGPWAMCPEALHKMAAKYPEDKVINLLPLDEQKAILRTLV